MSIEPLAAAIDRNFDHCIKMKAELRPKANIYYTVAYQFLNVAVLVSFFSSLSFIFIW